MFSRCRNSHGRAWPCSALFCAIWGATALHAGVLRVCADPNNLPFSNQRGEGFENRLAELVSRDLGMKLEYTWWSQRDNFVRHSLLEGHCDVLLGIPADLDEAAATRPYYRSTYVFVSRADRHLGVTSLWDPRLEQWRIGIHVVGEDYAPPARALARRGITSNVVAYSLFGKAGEPNPPARIVEGVAAGEVDVAIVWGPFAGYFAKEQKLRLEIAPVSPPRDGAVPFTYAIAMGVRKDDPGLRKQLDDVVGRECGAIQRILAEYAVPQAGVEKGKPICESSGEPSASWH